MYVYQIGTDAHLHDLLPLNNILMSVLLIITKYNE